MMNEFDSTRAIRASQSAETVLFRCAKNNVQTNTSFAQRKANESSLYLATPNWAYSRLFCHHNLLHCLIVCKRSFSRDRVRNRTIALVLNIDTATNAAASNVALKRHALLRALQRHMDVVAHVRIGIAGHHPQALKRGRDCARHRQDIVLPAALGLHQNRSPLTRIP
jgi:hypothetical protein